MSRDWSCPVIGCVVIGQSHDWSCHVIGHVTIVVLSRTLTVLDCDVTVCETTVL